MSKLILLDPVGRRSVSVTFSALRVSGHHHADTACMTIVNTRQATANEMMTGCVFSSLTRGVGCCDGSNGFAIPTVSLG